VPLPNQFAANVLPIVRTIQASGIMLVAFAPPAAATGARARYGTCSAEQRGLIQF
jgi:hypothetical protein